MTTMWTVLVPAVSVLAGVEAVRSAPTVRANVRARRRLDEAVTTSSVPVAPDAVASPPTSVPGSTPMPTGRRPMRRAVVPGSAPLVRMVDDHRRRRLDRAVPERLDRIVRRLRAGSTLPDAIVGVGTDDDLLASLAADIAAGHRLAPAVRRWRAADPSPNRRLAAVALELSAEAGGSGAAVLDGVAESLRDRVALEREVAALSSQARASAVLLVVAPVVFTLVVGAVEPRLWSMLFGSPIGWACLAIGLGLDGLGAAWMARLVGRHR